MINALITAGGVTTVWHMVNVAKAYLGDSVCVHVCDTNRRELVPAATMADHFYRVPGFAEAGYYAHMLDLMENNDIEVIIPLIDQDLFIWPCDNPDLIRRNIRSTGAPLATVETLSNKRRMHDALRALNLPTPAIIVPQEMENGRDYIVKSEVGCGSQGMRVIRKTDDVRFDLPDGAVIQEKCDGEACEVTAEVFNSQDMLKVFCRRRIATKAGVCVKAEPVEIPEIAEYIRRLTAHVQCPSAFCAQFLMHRGRWNMIDCNLRLGAGTALSSAAGFQLVRAFWSDLCGNSVDEAWLRPDPTVKTMLRVYEELVIR